MSIIQVHKYCLIDIKPWEIRMLHKASQTFSSTVFPTKKERIEKGNKMLYSKSKKIEEQGKILLNSPSISNYESFIDEIESYHKVQENVVRFNVKNTNMKLYKYDPVIIITLLEHLLKSDDLNDNDPSTYYGTLKSEYIFRSEVESFLKDMREIDITMKAKRIIKMDWE